MNQTSNPGTSSGGVGGSGSGRKHGVTQRRLPPPTLPAPRGRPQPKLGSTNLLPSKVHLGALTGARLGAPGRQSVGGKLLYTSVLGGPPKGLAEGERLDNAYTLYLQNYLLNGLMKEMELIQEVAQSDKLTVKCIEASAFDQKVSKIYINKEIINTVKVMETIGELSRAFDDLVDFTGEETLVEIQSILSRKFDKIVIVGDETGKCEAIENVNLKQVMDTLKAKFRDCNEEQIMGFCVRFVEAFRTLASKLDTISKQNENLHAENKEILETCSLTICALGQSKVCPVPTDDETSKEVQSSGT